MYQFGVSFFDLGKLSYVDGMYRFQIGSSLERNLLKQNLPRGIMAATNVFRGSLRSVRSAL